MPVLVTDENEVYGAVIYEDAETMNLTLEFFFSQVHEKITKE